MRTPLEKFHQLYVEKTNMPPACWTLDLDGKPIIVDLLEPLGHGKWSCLDEDAEPIVVDENHLDISTLF